MKTKIKIALLVLAAIVVIAASRSGDPPLQGKADTLKGCYTQEEVLLLMNANGWSKQEAVYVLELSCKYPVTPDQE